MLVYRSSGPNIKKRVCMYVVVVWTYKTSAKATWPIFFQMFTKPILINNLNSIEQAKIVARKVFFDSFLKSTPILAKYLYFFQNVGKPGMWAPSKGIISKMVFWTRTTILQRAFDINTMEFGLEVGARLGSTERERTERSKGMFLTRAVSTTWPISTNFAPNVAE